MISSEDYGKY